jgi:metal-sulfur cluster biosynthetic enzyme
MNAREHLAAAVRDSLRAVIDPEIGLNIVDVGLVYRVAADDAGVVTVTMTTTTQGCPATFYLRQGDEEAAARTAGVAAANVTLTYDPPWGPELMSETAQEILGFGR